MSLLSDGAAREEDEVPPLVCRGDELVVLLRLSPWQARFLAQALGMAAYEMEQA
jgi:hypothetical protein